ncbi:MAG: hypothetical protein K1X57_15365 [Gemmataceae bacterium]|nr:hypothetical protein [Gemmataceae bacterium]
MAAYYVVDSLGNLQDGQYGPGQLTFAEAIALSNASKGLSDTITFSPAVFSSPQSLNGGHTISDSVLIEGLDTPITIKYGLTTNDGNSSNVLNVTIRRMTFSGAYGYYGGGALTNKGENLALDNVTIVGNRAAKFGAGIYNESGTLTIENSVIAHNTVGTDLKSGSGGGILGKGVLTVRNTTIANNSAKDYGGGISWQGPALIANSTITGNTAFVGGGLCGSSSDTVQLSSSILSGNTASYFGGDFSYGSLSAKYSIVGVIGGNKTQSITLNNTLSGTIQFPLLPRLSSLGYHNGSKTLTMAPLPGSPAIDAGSNEFGLAYDQRGSGFPRVTGTKADIGAHEGLSNLPTFLGTSLHTDTFAGDTSYTFSVTYFDATGIDTSSLSTGDLTVTGPNGFQATPSFVSFSADTSGTTVTALYTFMPPGGSWDIADNGIYSVSLNAEQVFDSDFTHNAAPAGLMGWTKVEVVTPYVVDNLSVDADGKYGPGQLTLGEAVYLANQSKGTFDYITFAPALFAGKVIDINYTLGVSDRVRIVGPAGGVTFNQLSSEKRLLSVNIPTNNFGYEVVVDRVSFTNGTAYTGNGGAILITRGTLFYSNGVISGAKAPGHGGAIAVDTTSNVGDVTLTDVTITANRAGGHGGAIYAATQRLKMTRTVISDNTAALSGGGVYLLSSMDIVDSAIVGNVAQGTGGGGGVFFSSDYTSDITLINSTVSGNTTSGSGGGVNFKTAQLRIYGSTIANNSSTISGGGIAATQGAVLKLGSSIVAGNVSGDSPDISGNVSSAKSSLIQVAPSWILAGGGNLIGHDPRLLPLGSAGGPRPAHALAAGSPARDAGLNQLNAPADQNGSLRSLGAGPDMGAIESTDPTPSVAVLDLVSPLDNSTAYSFVVTLRDDIGIDTTTLGTGDITVTGPGGYSSPATLISIEPATTNSLRRATFSIPAPGGTWNSSDGGEYSLSIAANSIFDLDTTPRGVPGGPFITFRYAPTANLIVDEASDLFDNDFSAGKLSLREALFLADLNVASPDTITFATGLFGSVKSLAIGSPLSIASPIQIIGPGPGLLTISIGGTDRLFAIAPSNSDIIDVSISGVTLTGGFSNLAGGAVFASNTRLTISDAVLHGNTAATGGAIAGSDSTITVLRSTLRNNSATGSGGAIAALSGDLQFIDSVAHANRAGVGGGAIHANGYTVLIRNSTLSANTALVRGGGVDQPVSPSDPQVPNTVITIHNSTIVNNSAGIAGGVNQLRTGTTGSAWLELHSSVITRNTSTDILDVSSHAYGDIYYSAIGAISVHTNSDFVGNRPFGEDPLLGPLADNGGPTLSHLPLYGSPLKDNGSNIASLTLDQRGMARLIGSKVDIGSVEAFPDRPWATATLAPVNTPGGVYHTVQVTWNHPTAINVSTLDNQDVVLTGPNGYSAPGELLGVDFPSNGTPRVATYRFVPPGGSWEVHDAGTYSLKVNAGQVTGSDGLTNDANTIGSFTVGMAGTLVVTNANTSGPGSLVDMIARANANPFDETISFDPVFFSTPRTIAMSMTVADEITTNLVIQGPGRDKLTVYNSNSSFYAFNTGPAIAIEFRDFTLDMPGGRGISSDASSVTLSGMHIFSDDAGRALELSNNQSVTINDSMISGRNGTFSQGYAASITGASTVTIRRSLFQDAKTVILAVQAGTITVDATTFTAVNSATLHADGPIIVRNTTFTGGGTGLYVTGTAKATLTMDNSTIVNNTHQSYAGLWVDNIPGTVRGTVVTGNVSSSGWINIKGNSITATHSLIGPGSSPLLPASHSNLPPATDPRLGALADNGGGLLTRAPLPGSPLINAGSNAAGLLVDQRGFPRVAGGTPDIGAVEGLRAAPQAVMAAPDSPVPGTTETFLTVTYHDDLAIDVSSIDSNDVLVTGPGGFSQLAQLISIDSLSDGTPRTANYRLAAPGGTWDHTDDGEYLITLQAGSITDTTLMANPQQLLNSFTVAIPQSLVVTTDADSGPGSLRAAVAMANAIIVPDVITFDPTFFATPRTIKLTGGELVISDNLTITGPSSQLVTISGNKSSRILVINATSPIRLGLAGLTLIDGTGQGSVSPGFGGAILVGDDTLHISASILKNNTATNGGAISLLAGGTLILEDSTLEFNSASLSGGAISATTIGELTIRTSTLRANTALSNGGAISVEPTGSTGKFLIAESLLRDNSSGNRGGGLHFLASNLVASAIVRNTTFSGNHAWTSGGGLYLTLPAQSTFAIANSTIVGNVADNPGTQILRGGGIDRLTGQLTIDSSIVAFNSSSMAPDIASGLAFTSRHSAIGSGAFVTLTTESGNNLPFGTDLKLAPLADNGGSTLTHALLPGSPAINVGSNTAGLVNDQRGSGYPRTFGVGTDIGAYESLDAGAAPAVPVTATLEINDGEMQRSQLTRLAVTFSQSVTFPAGLAAAIRLDRITPAANVPLVFEQTGNTIKITFSSAAISLPNGSLPDGRYALTIDAQHIGGGNFDGNADGTVGDDLTLSVHRLFGDADGNATINSADFLAFRLAFLSSSSTFDVDGDNQVTAADFLQFRLRFLQSV